MFAMPQTVVMSKSGPKFTDIVLSLILRCVIRSSYDKSYDVVRFSYDIF